MSQPSQPSHPLPTVFMRADRVRIFEKRHPWLFSGAIQSVTDNPTDGALVDVRAPGGDFLARGYWNSQSQIRVHLLTWDEAETIDAAFWRKRLWRAITARHLAAPMAAGRLVNAESDGLPGLVVDRYADFLVLQALTLGIDQRKSMIAKLLLELLPEIRGVYERSDVDVRGKEGLPGNTGLLAGVEPPEYIEINEITGASDSARFSRFWVDVRNGHKTGFYLDQAVNRRALGSALATLDGDAERLILNCFSYTGGFAVHAGHAPGNNRVINIDASAEALNLARRNLALNGLTTRDDDFVVGDVFQILRHYRAEGRQFDGIILDPPKFVHHQGQIERGSRGYKDINLLAFQLIRPGGLLMTFSCSGLVDADLFQKIIFGAMIDAKREAQIVQYLAAGPDHPVSLNFPEGAYLKGLLCRVW